MEAIAIIVLIVIIVCKHIKIMSLTFGLKGFASYIKTEYGKELSKKEISELCRKQMKAAFRARKESLLKKINMLSKWLL